MGVARRLYLYAVSSFSLLVLAIGLYNLVALVFGKVADALGSTFLGGGADVGREQVSLAIALVVVGAPLFAIHWSLVGRGWRAVGASGLEDRHSALRAFHMALVATVALIFATGALVQVVERAFGTVFGTDDELRATDLRLARHGRRGSPDLVVPPATARPRHPARPHERRRGVDHPVPPVCVDIRGHGAPGLRRQPGPPGDRVRARGPARTSAMAARRG